MIRCVNIDWLECYCLEVAINYPHNADFFRAQGWQVNEREYGTPMYEEMFTLIDHYDQPFAEIRRKPKSDNSKKTGIFDPYSCHVRLTNRSCYMSEAAKVFSQFLEQYGFAFQRISRIDLCYDFERFDYGDEPQKFMQRFMAGRYSKINQANISAYGLDQWDGRAWNSVAWGSPKSMVKTRFYNKTMELREAHDKPYIRQAWQACGLVDDMVTLEKKRRDGTLYKPEIWRVEFAIKSSTKKWFVVEDYNGDRKRVLSKPNTLDVYYTREQIWQVFLSLAHHYFHFKHVEYKSESKAIVATAIKAVSTDELSPLVGIDKKAVREMQRKDRCHDKVLFRTDQISTFYQIERLATKTPRNVNLDRLLKRLYEYRNTVTDWDVRKACNTIISKLENDRTLDMAIYPFDKTELELLRRVIAIRLKAHDVPLSTTRKEVEAMLKIEKEIWSNPY